MLNTTSSITLEMIITPGSSFRGFALIQGSLAFKLATSFAFGIVISAFFVALVDVDASPYSFAGANRTITYESSGVVDAVT